MILLRACAFVAALSLLAVPSGRAAEIDDLSREAFAGKSWLDLLRQALPDIAADPRLKHVATAGRGVELKPLGDTFGEGGWGAPIRVISVEAHRATIGGRPRLVLALTLENEAAAPLLLFEGDGEGRLLDAANVKTDQQSSLIAPGLRPLGPQGALLTARSTHSNSNQAYAIASLVLVSAERFSLIGAALTYSERDCRKESTQDLAIATRPAAAMATIELSVTQRVRRNRADCETPAGRETRRLVRGAYVWNAARGAYVPRRAALDRLEKANEGRF